MEAYEAFAVRDWRFTIASKLPSSCAFARLLSWRYKFSESSFKKRDLNRFSGENLDPDKNLDQQFAFISWALNA